MCTYSVLISCVYDRQNTVRTSVFFFFNNANPITKFLFIKYSHFLSLNRRICSGVGICVWPISNKRNNILQCTVWNFCHDTLSYYIIIFSVLLCSLCRWKINVFNSYLTVYYYLPYRLQALFWNRLLVIIPIGFGQLKIQYYNILINCYDLIRYL